MKHALHIPDSKVPGVLYCFMVFIYGCSSSYSVSSTGKPDAEYSYRDMNEQLKGWHVTIELKGGREITAREMKISDDSVSWVVLKTDEESRTSVHQLGKLVMKNRLLGFVEGLGIGLVGGGGLGALIGNSLDHGGGDFGSGFGAFVGFLFGGGVGTVLGGLTGLTSGHSYTYEFTTTEHSDSLRNGN